MIIKEVGYDGGGIRYRWIGEKGYGESQWWKGERFKDSILYGGKGWVGVRTCLRSLASVSLLPDSDSYTSGSYVLLVSLGFSLCLLITLSSTDNVTPRIFTLK